MKKHLNIKIYGQVQGVSFRYYAFEQAEKLKIVGFAKNEVDGSVYIEAEGERKDLEKFLSWCKNGPTFAIVESLKTEESTLKNFDKFEIS